MVSTVGANNSDGKMQRKTNRGHSMTTTTNLSQLKAAAEDFARRVRAALGDRVDSIVLYGSVARGEAGPDSDIDVLVVGSRDGGIGKAIRKVESDRARETGYRFFVETTAYDRDEFLRLRRLGSPLVMNMLEDGVVLYDTGIFSKVRADSAQVSVAEMEVMMARRVARHLELADEALGDAQYSLDGGRLRSAAGRAYYAMFHAASAAVARTDSRPPRTHGGVANQFGLHYVTTGLFDAALAERLMETYELRRQRDYQLDVSFAQADVVAAVRDAREFVSAVRDMLD